MQPSWDKSRRHLKDKWNNNGESTIEINQQCGFSPVHTSYECDTVQQHYLCLDMGPSLLNCNLWEICTGQSTVYFAQSVWRNLLDLGRPSQHCPPWWQHFASLSSKHSVAFDFRMQHEQQLVEQRKAQELLTLQLQQQQQQMQQQLQQMQQGLKLQPSKQPLQVCTNFS